MSDSTNGSILKSNDIAFPRGGTSGLTPLEVKEISNEATKDVLFGTDSTEPSGLKRKSSTGSSQSHKKSRRGKKKSAEGIVNDAEDENDEDSETTVEIENFNFKNMIPGTKVLGQIIKINKLDMLVALGDNLFGILPVTNVSEELTKRVESYAADEQQSSDEEEDDDDDNEDKEIKTGTLKTQGAEFPVLEHIFSIGQWINAQIMDPKDNKTLKQIELSIEPNVINKDLENDDLNSGNVIQGSIISREDHGLVLNIGKSDMSGFIPNKYLKDSDQAENIEKGKVILTTIVSKSSRSLSLKPVEASGKSSNVSTISSIDAIQPGIVINALVSNVSKNGIVTRVFGLVDGTISLAHLNEYNHDKLQHKYGIGNNIKARVIGVLSKGGTKKLILSQLPHIMGFQNPVELHKSALEAFPIGFKFDQVKIKGIDHNYIYLDLGEFTGQVHLSKVDNSKSIGLDYTIGSSHAARVIDFNEFDNILMLSMDPQVIDAKYLHVSDVPDGEYDRVEVVKVLPNSEGILVKVLEKFDGFVPSIHMSDIKLTYPEIKFRAGSKVKARVLRKERNKLIVTLKKTLVNLEDDELLTNVDNASIGFKTIGTVDRFVNNGAIISFFGYLKAYLPKEEISETFVTDARRFLKIGQSVSIKIKGINEEKRMLVTLKQSIDSSNDKQNSFDGLVAGKSLIETTVIQRTKDSIIVESSNGGVKGIIYSGHLSDGNYEQNREKANKLSIGDKLTMLVLEKDLKNKNVIGSCKPSLIKASKTGELPASFSDIQIDDKMIYGYIKSVTNMGLFISFGGKLTGLALAKYVPDNYKDNLSKHFFKYQSITCRVIRVDSENKRFLLSLKDIKPTDDISQSEDTINPIDEKIKYIGEYKPGLVTKAIIKSIKGTQLNVQLADNVQGRVDCTQCFNDFNDIINKSQPLSQFKKGEKINVKIIGFHDSKNHKFLPITHKKSNKHTIFELSLLDDIVSGKRSESLQISDIKPGMKYPIFVNNIQNNYVWVSLSPSIKGRISFMELSDDSKIFENLNHNLPIGSVFEATVNDVNHDHNMVSLSCRTNIPKTIKDLEIGKKYPARILKIKETFVLVSLGDDIIASSFITDALDDYSESLDSVFKQNDFATATVLAIDIDASKIAVSLRSDSPKDKLINSPEDVKRGDVLKGFIKSISNIGLHVSLGRSVQALVRVSDLSDSFIKDWKKHFNPYQLVIGKISKNEGEGRIAMTLKESEIHGELKSFKTFEDLNPGEVYEGSIKSVTDFGVFVKLNDTFNVSGLCHHSEISDNKIDDLKKLFGEGDRVKVKILKIFSDKKQLSLGMKASYFTKDIDMEDAEDQAPISDDDDDDENDSEDEESEDQEDQNDDVDDDNSDNENDDGIIDVEDAEEDSDDEHENDDDDDDNNNQGLSTGGFDWTASILDQADNDDESSDDDEDFTERKKKKTKKSKKYAEDKTGDINTRAPQSTGDFERLIIGNPNSSILWMNYMSFQLQLSELDKAREIGERALKTINYTEEQEKLNIWIALLNLENSFGTEESLDETFKRACQYMDSLTMHQKLASIFIMSENFNKVDDLYKKMFKKFGPDNVQIWVNYASNLLDRNLNDDCHEVLAKALQSLPKRDHIEVVKKFAQLEYEKGELEQGRSLFEGLINDAPKRIDLWNVYIDKEIKFANDKSKVEDLFERVITKKLSKKQAKFFFNKWVEYEESHDDERGALRAKAKAAEYVEALNKN